MQRQLNIIPLVVLMLLGVIFAYPQNVEEDEVVKIESSLVVLNATITDRNGQPVFDLKASQFKVFEDGVEQDIEVFETAKTPFSAVILLDTSGSMEERISLARSAAINFLDGLRIDDTAAIFKFDSKVSLVQDFSNSRDAIPQFYDLKAQGWTVLNDAVVRAANELQKRPERRRAIVILSDGADNKSGDSASDALKAASDAGATIYAVDMSNSDDKSREKLINQGMLKNFAEKTGGLFVATPGGVKMREAFKNIVDELGVQYTIAYEPKNSKKDGKWRKLELRVASPNLNIRTRKGYNARKEKR